MQNRGRSTEQCDCSTNITLACGLRAQASLRDLLAGRTGDVACVRNARRRQQVMAAGGTSSGSERCALQRTSWQATDVARQNENVREPCNADVDLSVDVVLM